MIQIHKHDKGELYSIYGFFIDPDKDVWVDIYEHDMLEYDLGPFSKTRDVMWLNGTYQLNLEPLYSYISHGIQIKVSDVLKAITDYKPIFGHRTTIKNQTIWMAFMK